MDLDTDLAAPTGPGRHPLPDPGRFRARLEAAGIGDDDEVVAYDDVGGWVAARLWWMLDNLGHRRVAVLDGGLPAWVAAGFPVTTDRHRRLRAGQPPPARPVDQLIDREAVAAGLGRIVLLDARGAPRYRGEVEPIDPVPGHIPTAMNAPPRATSGRIGRLLAPPCSPSAFPTLGADGPWARSSPRAGAA